LPKKVVIARVADDLMRLVNVNWRSLRGILR